MEIKPLPKLGKYATIGARIKQIRDERKLNQTDFAKKLGVKTSTISEYERGNSKPTGLFLVAFEAVYQVCKEWVLTGDGPKRVEPRGFSLGYSPQIASGNGHIQIGGVNGGTVSVGGQAPGRMAQDHPAVELQPDDSRELAEVVDLLRRYGSKQLLRKIREQLIKVKEVTEG